MKLGHPKKYSLTCLVSGDIFKKSIFKAKKKLQAFLCGGGSYVTPPIEFRGGGMNRMFLERLTCR